MKKVWEAGMILLALTGFWGMIYPDLCFTQDVCGIVCEDTAAEDGKEIIRPEDEEKNGKDIFTQLCEAKSGQIRVRFRLFDEKSEDRMESKGKEDVGKKERGTS